MLPDFGRPILDSRACNSCRIKRGIREHAREGTQAPHFLAAPTVTRYTVTRYARGVLEMVEAADRMKAMRERRRARGLRELRLIVPDARSKSVRRRVARQVAALDRSREIDALNWIEAVSEFDDR